MIWERLAMCWAYPFVRYALAVGVLIALCTALLGVPLVLRRFSLLGDGLSHVAFGAMAVSSVLGLTNDLPLPLVLTMLCAVLLLRTGQGRGAAGDALLAMLWGLAAFFSFLLWWIVLSCVAAGDALLAMLSVGALAIGYLLLNLFSPSGNLSGDVCTTLFGSTSILTLTLSEVRLCLLLSAVVLAVSVLCGHRLFAVPFDPAFARAAGVRTERYDLLLAVVIAVVTVLAMELVGALLVSALVVFPALSAMRLAGSWRAVTVGAAVLSVTCAAVGILTAAVAGTPVGATVVAADLVAFLVCSAVGRLRGGVR